MKNIFISIAFLFISCSLSAQSLTDAVRYSRFQVAGTARTAGVGGSFGAMGGDFGSLNINPAGMADFYKSQLNMGFSFNNSNTSSFLVKDTEQVNEVADNTLNLNHFGYIKATRPKGDLVTSNFYLNFSQLNNFSEEIFYDGKTKGTITERFAEVANTLDLNSLDPFEAGVAYDAGAIYDKEGDLFYETDFLDTTSLINKNQYIDRVGRMNEISLGWAGNYDNIVNFGFSLGFPFVSFEEYKTYIEDDPDGDEALFTRLEYIENLSTSGAGLNFKMGITGKIAQKFRLGFAFHSPTWLTLTDDYSTSLTYTFDDGGPSTFSAESGDGRFKYKLLTPMKFIASGGVVFDMGELKGFVNADVELQNFSNADFDFTSFGESASEAVYEAEVNKDIQGELTNALSARLGVELAYKVFRARLGLNGEGSPYLIDDGAFSRRTISGGMGLRFNKFYFDVTGYSYNDEEGFYPYLVLTDGRNSLVNTEKSTFKMMMSLGFMF